MRLFTGERREFTEVEIEFFKVVALFCTSAIIDSMFHRILTRVTQAIRHALEPPEVLDSIVRVVCEDLRSPGCAMHLVYETSSALEARAAYGLTNAFVDKLADSFSKKVADDVLEGNAVAISDVRGRPRGVSGSHGRRRGSIGPSHTAGQPRRAGDRSPQHLHPQEIPLFQPRETAHGGDRRTVFAGHRQRQDVRRAQTALRESGRRFSDVVRHLQSNPQRGSTV